MARCALGLVIVAALVAVTAARPAVTLNPRTFEPLPASSVTPRGWLLTQLELQAEGLSGHLALFWGDIMNSSWIGGPDDGGLHERTPYWLNGIVPLAFLLKNANSSIATDPTPAAPKEDVALCQNSTDMPNLDIYSTNVSDTAACKALCEETAACVAFVVDACQAPLTCWLKYGVGPVRPNTPCRCFGALSPRPEPPVNIFSQATEYINYVVAHQTAAGWLGADDDTSGNMYWSRFPMLLALAAYADGVPERADEIAAVMLKFTQEASRRMAKTPMDGWSMWRGQDFALGVQWLLAKHPQGQEAFLGGFLATIRAQTSDWESWFQNFTVGASPHGVNNAQALKSSGVWAIQDTDPALHASSIARLHNMDSTYGMASGMFCADEILCEPAQRKMPSRGTELCTVVEAMFSYNTLFSVHGDVMFADRAERIAYNALPATFASPRGGDMWNHQYLQALNEVNAMVNDTHVWTHDGGDAEIYGLAPNYGCCTANFNQGWPKFAQLLIFSTSDGGAAVGALAPVSGMLPSGANVTVDTDFPYSDVVVVRVQTNAAMPLYLRVPTWATNATVAINGAPPTVAPAGAMFKASLPAGASSVTLALNPTVRLEHWYSNDTVSVHRGALMYSLPIKGNYTMLNQYAFESRDYQVLPLTEWRYALQLATEDPASSFSFETRHLQPGEAPFNTTLTSGWPAALHVAARVTPDWHLEQNSAAAPPVSPACTSPTTPCGKPERVTLVPYGSTDLRISEMPWA